MTTSGAANLGEITLGYRSTGSANGVPVVLLHALGDDATTWDRFASELAARDRRAIAVDLRGHGASSRPGEYSFELMVDDVLAFLDDGGLARIDLVGHSMGGMVAQLLAGREPHRVRRMVIEDAAPVLPDAEPETWTPPERPADPVPFDWAVVPAIQRAARTKDPARWQALRRITAPTLWLSGGAASHVAPARIEAAAAEIASATVATIPVGHLIHETAPAPFAAAALPHLG